MLDFCRPRLLREYYEHNKDLKRYCKLTVSLIGINILLSNFRHNKVLAKQASALKKYCNYLYYYFTISFREVAELKQKVEEQERHVIDM